MRFWRTHDNTVTHLLIRLCLRYVCLIVTRVNWHGKYDTPTENTTLTFRSFELEQQNDLAFDSDYTTAHRYVVRSAKWVIQASTSEQRELGAIAQGIWGGGSIFTTSRIGEHFLLLPFYLYT